MALSRRIDSAGYLSRLRQSLTNGLKDLPALESHLEDGTMIYSALGRPFLRMLRSRELMLSMDGFPQDLRDALKEQGVNSWVGNWATLPEPLCADPKALRRVIKAAHAAAYEAGVPAADRLRVRTLVKSRRGGRKPPKPGRKP